MRRQVEPEAVRDIRDPELARLVVHTARLLTIANGVFVDRMARPNSKKWDTADNAIRYNLYPVVDTSWSNLSSEQQIRRAASHVRGLMAATQLALWTTFCGRTHRVPTQQIAELRAMVRHFVENQASR